MNLRVNLTCCYVRRTFLHPHCRTWPSKWWSVWTLAPASICSHSCLSLTYAPRSRHFPRSPPFRFLCVIVWIWIVPASLMCSRLGCQIVVLQGSSETFRRQGQQEGSEVPGRWPGRGHWDLTIPSHSPCFPFTIRWAVSSTMCSVSSHTASPQAPSNGDKRQWTKTSQTADPK